MITIAGYLRASKIVINEIRMRHWLGEWQAQRDWQIEREHARESERAKTTSAAVVIDVARVSVATKNACLPFLFCGMFLVSFFLSTFFILFFHHVCQVQLLFAFCHFSYALASNIFELRHKLFCIFAQTAEEQLRAMPIRLNNRFCQDEILMHFIPYPIYRQDCFGSPFFNACVEALQLHEEMDKYNEWRDTLGRK